MNEKGLSSERGRELRRRHPLFSRLSGDVIWALYEDLGYDAEACGRAMDDFIARMHTVLEAVDRLEKGEARYFALENIPPGCVAALPRKGEALCAHGVGWQQLLPPYAVGCPVTVRVLADEAGQAGDTAQGCTTKPAFARPGCPLLCPLLEEEQPAPVAGP